MQPLEPVINYLVDPNNGLKHVITKFLNVVMLFEAYLQSGAPMSASLRERHIETQ